jgi:hypothetical protein
MAQKLTVVCVIDTGMGICDEAIPCYLKVCNRFFEGMEFGLSDAKASLGLTAETFGRK